MPGNTVWLTDCNGVRYRGVLIDAALFWDVVDRVDRSNRTSQGYFGTVEVEIWHWLYLQRANNLWAVRALAKHSFNVPLVLDYRGSVVNLDWDALFDDNSISSEVTVVYDLDKRLHRISALTFWRFNPWRDCDEGFDNGPDKSLLKPFMELACRRAKPEPLLVDRSLVRKAKLKTGSAEAPRLQTSLLIAELTDNTTVVQRLKTQLQENLCKTN